MERASFERRCFLTHPQSEQHQIQCQSSEEYFQSFSESRGCIVREKGAEGREKKTRFRRTIREEAASHVGDEKARSEIKQHLHQQHGAKIIHAKDGEDRREECRIPGQSRKRGNNLAGVGYAIDPEAQPILRNVGIKP